MAAHHGCEGTELHPTGVEFLILRIASGGVEALRIVGIGEKATNVGIDVWVGCERVVEADGHLLAEAFPRGADVAAPGVGSVALLSCEVGTGEDEDALGAVDGTLMVIHATYGHEGEGVAHAAVGTHGAGLVEVAVFVAVVVGVGRVHPPGIDAHLVET